VWVIVTRNESNLSQNGAVTGGFPLTDSPLEMVNHGTGGHEKFGDEESEVPK